MDNLYSSGDSRQHLGSYDHIAKWTGDVWTSLSIDLTGTLYVGGEFIHPPQSSTPSSINHPKCQHCGQYGEPYKPCNYCGAPIVMKG